MFCGDLNGSAFLDAGESGFLATLPVGGRGREFVGELTTRSAVIAVRVTVFRYP